MYLCKDAPRETLRRHSASHITQHHHYNKDMNQKLRNILLSACLLMAGSPMATAATDKAYWTDGNGKVTYTINAEPSLVVKAALQLFEGDMKALTGQGAKAKASGAIQIFQLNRLTNKEFAALEKLGAPIHKIIIKKDAFYIGTRNGKTILVGSDGRGTAYGIMELSRLAGVSPWIDWADALPQQRKVVGIDRGYESLQVPSVEYRGLALNGSPWMNAKNSSQIARLMLRLRANTLWQNGNRHSELDKAVTDSFEIALGNGNKITEVEEKKGKKANKHKHAKSEVRLVWDCADLYLSDTQPGLLAYELATPSDEHAKTHNAWIANVRNPKMAPYQLSLFMDLAWNHQSATAASLPRHLQTWLTQQFGAALGRTLTPIMTEYYRLTAIRQPTFMVKDFGDTEFHSGEFGNELERYLYAYDLLKTKVDNLERSVPSESKDAYFELIKYPIFAAASIAEKELEAQEARHIARPGLFAHDDEAKAAAALSLRAYRQLQQLNAYYLSLGKGKWRPYLDLTLPELKAPSLPGTLSNAEIAQYAADAIDRSTDLKPFIPQKSDIIARNAADWTTTSGKGITPIPLLGHSNKAVALPQGSSLNYVFTTNQSGDARFTLAAIPHIAHDKGDIKVAVSIDHGEPIVCTFTANALSSAWKQALWRGQAQKSFFITLDKGNHTVEVKALTDHVAIDQWAVDFDTDREYYLIPTTR